MKKRIKIIITEDKEKYRNVLIRELTPYDFDIIGVAENGQELLNLLETLVPDVVFLDLEMPVMNGTIAYNHMRVRYPNINVIILSTHYHPNLYIYYREIGVKGYIPKDALIDMEEGLPVMINAINKVCESGTFFYQYPSEEPVFNKVQEKIIPLTLQGLTNKEIGKEIGISSRAVQKQKINIHKKTGVEKTIDFYKYAISKGLQFLGVDLNKKKE